MTTSSVEQPPSDQPDTKRSSAPAWRWVALRTGLATAAYIQGTAYIQDESHCLSGAVLMVAGLAVGSYALQKAVDLANPRAWKDFSTSTSARWIRSTSILPIAVVAALGTGASMTWAEQLPTASMAGALVVGLQACAMTLSSMFVFTSFHYAKTKTKNQDQDQDQDQAAPKRSGF